MCILLCVSAATGCVVGAAAALPGKAVALARAAAVEREVGTSRDAGFGWPGQRPKCPGPPAIRAEKAGAPEAAGVAADAGSLASVSWRVM